MGFASKRLPINIKILIYLRDNNGYTQRVDITKLLNDHFKKHPEYHPSGLLQKMKQEGLISPQIQFAANPENGLKHANALITTTGMMHAETYLKNTKRDWGLIINFFMLIVSAASAWIAYSTSIENQLLQKEVGRLDERIRTVEISEARVLHSTPSAESKLRDTLTTQRNPKLLKPEK